MKSASEVMVELRTAGGPGSGRYPAGSTLYHGTSKAQLKSILANGLQSSRALDDEDAGKVFLTTSKERAEQWAIQVASDWGERNDGSDVEVAVLTVQVPTEHSANLMPDTNQGEMNNAKLDFAHNGNIPKEWIKEAAVARLVDGKGQWLKVLAEAGPHYAIVVFSKNKAPRNIRVGQR